MLVPASIYTWFFIHEIKGVRMDQMDDLFGFERPKTDYASKVVKEGGFDGRGGKQIDTQVSRVEVA